MLFVRGFMVALLGSIIALAIAVAPMVPSVEGMDRYAAIGFLVWVALWVTPTLFKIASGRE